MIHLGQTSLRLCLLILSLFHCFAAGSDGPLPISQSRDIIASWSPNQHLYSRGDLTASNQDLKDLEAWLDQSAPNWTVFLTESSSGESYRDSFGKNFREIDAVERTLINGLQAKTKFGKSLEPRTKLPNGALLIISLKERTFAYFALSHYTKNGAPVSAWNNKLDRDARAVMRKNGGLKSAVQAAINSVNSRVNHVDECRHGQVINQLKFLVKGARVLEPAVS